ncbi:PLP-dependent transferase [Meira miltonrushii]|uniref:PLP-dependent transferase n=1 Tax=Meira miltonrushii TaxID=1280837 RepID=A0A316VAJ8_9BASI|nr:PLP-dependent transferase [Meira miltonrushii]PWN34512.1 PLP-dependent transferase [Meira miltonrushii]
MSDQPTAKNGLSRRGLKDLEEMSGRVAILLKMFANQFDAKSNPDGIVVLGIADNSLCRTELVEFFTSPGRLQLEPRDLTYADHFYASTRVLKAIAGLYNDVPDGLYSEKDWKPPLKRVEEGHILVGNGATEIIDACFWDLCDEGDGVLLSAPYYNAFDEDLSFRAKVQIVQVHMPEPKSGSGSDAKEPKASFAVDIIKDYEDALQKAKAKGIKCRAVLICNPHNPTGGIYPRETVVALAKFAAKHDLHLVMDEIYARGCFTTKAVPNPTPFDSILGIDVEKEAGLNPSHVHVISSASKDFSINGFRIGIFISQHNPDLITSMGANARFAQTASPAGQLFASLLNDRKYLAWFLQENRRRLTITFDKVTEFLSHHGIPFVPSNAGHFLLIDLQKYLSDGEQKRDGIAGQEAATGQESELTPERELTHKFIEGGVMLAPGSQYHYPAPGFFRMTFSIEPQALQVGLSRIEKVLGLPSWITSQPPVQF